MLEVDKRYAATVVDAFITESKEKATAGLFIAYVTEDGTIERTFWITPSTVDGLAETLGKCFGFTSDQLRDGAFLGGIGARMRGKEVSIVTEGREYKGETRIEVKWMNPAGFRPKKVEGSGLRRIAGIFGGGPVSSPAVVAGAAVTDDDVPF